MTDTLISTIEAAWENRAELGFSTEGAVREAVAEALNLLDSGNARVAEPAGEGWRVNQWLKKAVLLSFRLNDNALIPGGPGGSHWWDKSEEHTSELQSLMRISYAVFCLNKTTHTTILSLSNTCGHQQSQNT